MDSNSDANIEINSPGLDCLVNTDRQALLDHLETQYRLKELKFNFGDEAFVFWGLANPESILDEMTLEASHDQLSWQPYWAQLWDAAIGMCHELAQRSELAGKRVLDLGCGLGATGAVAAAKGANVLMVDNAPPALEFAILNSWQWRDCVQAQRLDWTTGNLDEKFDWILGADIVYDPRDLQQLDSFWRKHLSSSGQVLLSEPSRAMTGDLMKTLSQLGWSWHEYSREFPGIDCEIQFFEMSPDV